MATSASSPPWSEPGNKTDSTPYLLSRLLWLYYERSSCDETISTDFTDAAVNKYCSMKCLDRIHLLTLLRFSSS
ncbi:gp016 [Erwinia phage vB_EamP-S6]|uniref:Gp016 n=1 Tax=Erwinia phage vB_EamP-S6 TaxID=1051675 RepID=G0YQA8_9CAUD|nr:gp016 [Erwinia phage vB_EamP-S6]AEJ81535.1 gp016 [Erwinia phage vB_EamP-S6]